MSRVTSPPMDDRSTKRSRTSLETVEMNGGPENIVDIVEDGDALLVLNGFSSAPDTPIGLRVSRFALSMASPVFKSAFTTGINNVQNVADQEQSKNIISLPDDDGDAMYILSNVLHLRNDKLPARILPYLLCKLACLAQKYQCVVAAGRATLQWFDRLYASKNPGDIWQIIEAAYLLDEAMFFARFTSRWVLEQSVHTRQMPAVKNPETQKLALMLSDRHTQSITILRNDIDALIDTCAFAFSKQNKHYIDWAPGMSPDADETPTGQSPTECHVDPDGAMLYLGALRDAQIWPSTMWELPRAAPATGLGATVGDVVAKLDFFREPEYNDLDKCEFCEGVKIKFTEQLDTVKEVQKERLWGLCLDCFRAGGLNGGDCRYEHAKPQLAQGDGLGIKGL